MKKILALLLAAICWCGVCAQAPATPQPEMSLTHTSHDFGKVKASGGKVSHTFPFTNKGTVALLITDINTACKCTTAVFPRKPIAPGESGEIVITYDPKRQKGSFFKAIQVSTNEPSKRQMITAQGEVIK